jgi:hypothetical protein
MSHAVARSKAMQTRATDTTDWRPDVGVPTDEKDDRALKEAFDLLRGTITDAAFPPGPKAAVPK